MPHLPHPSSTAPLRRLPQTLWNLGFAGLVVLALPLLCCALMLSVRARPL